MARPRKTATDGASEITGQVKAIGAGCGQLLKLLEIHGAKITGQQFENVWGFLHRTIAQIEAQARKDRIVVGAGDFSLDGDQASEPRVTNGQDAVAHLSGPTDTHMSSGTPRAPRSPMPPAPVAPQPRPEGWVRPTGRISKNSPDVDMRGQLSRQPLPPIKVDDKLDPSAGITLLGSSEENKKDL